MDKMMNDAPMDGQEMGIDTEQIDSRKIARLEWDAASNSKPDQSAQPAPIAEFKEGESHIGACLESNQHAEPAPPSLLVFDGVNIDAAHKAGQKPDISQYPVKWDDLSQAKRDECMDRMRLDDSLSANGLGVPDPYLRQESRISTQAIEPVRY